MAPAAARETPEVRSPAERFAALGRVVRRRWVAALLAGTLVIALAVVYLATAARTYEARAQILLQPSDAVASIANPGGAVSAANAQRDVDTNAGLVTVAPVARSVIDRLGLTGTSPTELLKHVAVEGQENSNLVYITASDRSATRAAEIATAFAVEAGDYRQATIRAQVQASIEAGRRSLTELTDPAQRDAVARRVLGLQATQAVQSGGTKVVHRAAVPTSAASPRVRLVLAGTVLLAAIAALLAALLAERLDPRLRDTADVEEAFAAPVLATISDPRTASAQAADVASLLLARGEAEPGRVLLFADAVQGPLAGNVAERVCAHLRAAGLTVLLVEAGPRGELPAFDGGLAGIVLDDRPLGDAIARVRLTDDADAIDAYELLPFGADASQIGAVLNRRALAAVVDEARERADVVVIAGGGVLPTRGFLPLLRVSDALLLVVRERRTTRTQAEQVRAVMESDADALVGVIVATGGLPAPQRVVEAEAREAAARDRAPGFVPFVRAAR